VPAHHKAEAHVDAWIEAAGIGEEAKRPLFRTFGRNEEVTARSLFEADILRIWRLALCGIKYQGQVQGAGLGNNFAGHFPRISVT